MNKKNNVGIHNNHGPLCTIHTKIFGNLEVEFLVDVITSSATLVLTLLEGLGTCLGPSLDCNSYPCVVNGYVSIVAYHDVQKSLNIKIFFYDIT